MNGGPSAMPNAWKIVGSLLGLLTTIAIALIVWLNGSIRTNEREIARVEAQVHQEGKERSESQRKTDVSIEGIKGDIKQIQKDVERIERGQEKANTNIERVLEELRKRGRTP